MKFTVKKHNIPTIIISTLQIVLSICMMYVATDKGIFLLGLLALLLASLNITVGE